MAVYNAPLQPPVPFGFDCPDEWLSGVIDLKFRVASGLSKDDEERQISTLFIALARTPTMY